MEPTALPKLLKSLIAAGKALVAELEVEREVLVARDLDALAASLARKQQIIESIEQFTGELGSTPLGEQINAADAESRSELDVLHKALRETLDSARDYNAVNGKIVRRAQQSTRELIHLVSGTDADLLYGEQGQTAATAKGTAIARA